MTVHAICFDLDGTLLRDEHGDGVVRQVASELADAHGVDADALAAANEREWKAYWPHVGDAWMRGELANDEVPIEVWRRALGVLGVTRAGAAERAHALHVERETAAFELYPEAVDVIAQIRARGIRTAIITNGRSGRQRAKLAAVGLTGFNAVIVSGEVGVCKPDTAIFGHALVAMGAAAALTMHVGDNQIADVAGARAAGLTAVWIDRSGAEAASDPHHVVNDLRELLALI